MNSWYYVLYICAYIYNKYTLCICTMVRWCGFRFIAKIIMDFNLLEVTKKVEKCNYSTYDCSHIQVKALFVLIQDQCASV